MRYVQDEISTRVVPEVRRATLSILQNSLGRKLAAEDLLDRLREAGPFDDAVDAALRRDLADLKS